MLVIKYERTVHNLEEIKQISDNIAHFVQAKFKTVVVNLCYLSLIQEIAYYFSQNINQYNS